MNRFLADRLDDAPPDGREEVSQELTFLDLTDSDADWRWVTQPFERRALAMASSR